MSTHHAHVPGPEIVHIATYLGECMHANLPDQEKRKREQPHSMYGFTSAERFRNGWLGEYLYGRLFNVHCRCEAPQWPFPKYDLVHDGRYVDTKVNVQPPNMALENVYGLIQRQAKVSDPIDVYAFFCLSARGLKKPLEDNPHALELLYLGALDARDALKDEYIKQLPNQPYSMRCYCIDQELMREHPLKQPVTPAPPTHGCGREHFRQYMQDWKDHD